MELTRGLQSLRWDPDLGGRLVSWQVDDLELLAHRSDDPIEFGMYPMAPWAGRVRGNQISVESLRRMGIEATEALTLDVNYPPWALHGTCFTSAVDSMIVEDNSVISHQVIPQWPWSAELINTWTIYDDGLVATMTVRSDEVSPVILGWHPWFRRLIEGASARWSSADAEMSIRVDALPSDSWVHLTETSGPFDDAFRCPDNSVLIEWPGVLSLTVHSSHSWFVIFDEQPDAICVEPQTQIPNAWNHPLAGEPGVTGRGSDVTLTTQWRWSMDGIQSMLHRDTSV